MTLIKKTIDGKEGLEATIPTTLEYEQAVLSMILQHARVYLDSHDVKVHEEKGEDILRIIRQLMSAAYVDGSNDAEKIIEWRKNRRNKGK